MATAWESAWQPMIAAVGTDYGPAFSAAGADPVEPGAIRRFLEVLEFDCPLHRDEATARACGYSGIVAPQSSYMAFAAAPLWQPGSSPVFAGEEREQGAAPYQALLPPGTRRVLADLAIEYGAPVCVGDRLRLTGDLLTSCHLKETRLGRGAFTTWRSIIVNDRGQTVAIQTLTYFHYTPRGSDSLPIVRSVPPASARGGSDGSRSDVRNREDVDEGDQLAAVCFPLTVRRLVMAAAATRDFASVHHDAEAARAAGAADIYASSHFLLGMWERTVRDHIGPYGRITAVNGFRLRAHNIAGDTVRTGGRVLGKRDDQTVDIQVWSENSREITVGPGVVTVALPRRTRARGNL